MPNQAPNRINVNFLRSRTNIVKLQVVDYVRRYGGQCGNEKSMNGPFLAMNGTNLWTIAQNRSQPLSQGHFNPTSTNASESAGRHPPVCISKAARPPRERAGVKRLSAEMERETGLEPATSSLGNEPQIENTNFGVDGVNGRRQKAPYFQ